MAVFYKYQYTNKRKNIHPCTNILINVRIYTPGAGPNELQLSGWFGDKLNVLKYVLDLTITEWEGKADMTIELKTKW